MNNPAYSPILTCRESAEFERTFFSGDESRVLAAMQRAGVGVAESILEDFEEIGGLPENVPVRILVLAGKGNNGGDALVAAEHILRCYPKVLAEVLLLFPRELNLHAGQCLRSLTETGRERVRQISRGEIADAYVLCLDGVFGYRFHGALTPEIRSLFVELASKQIDMRASVDLPSGLTAEGAFSADFTYATGILKKELLELPNAGRLRYVDIGFFSQAVLKEKEAALFSGKRGDLYVLTDAVLDPLRKFRSAAINKRDKGHLFIVGGSMNYPGAVLMSVKAALRSGVGLVSVFLPAPLVPAFSAAAPEAIWLACPVSESGGISEAGYSLFLERSGQATAMLIGPGLGSAPDTERFVQKIIKGSKVPLVIDASALQPSLIKEASVPKILTPHIGEFRRISGGMSLAEFSSAGTSETVTVLKGPVTRIACGGKLYHSLFGGPVLSRGGSGDILAGIIAGLLAQEPENLKKAALCGTAWHGLSANRMARTLGQEAVATTDILGFMSGVLRKI